MKFILQYFLMKLLKIILIFMNFNNVLHLLQTLDYKKMALFKLLIFNDHYTHFKVVTVWCKGLFLQRVAVLQFFFL